jgi:hypothetical protein
MSSFFHSVYDLFENAFGSVDMKTEETEVADILVLLANFHYSHISIPLPIVVEIFNMAGLLPQTYKHLGHTLEGRNNANSRIFSFRWPFHKYVHPKVIEVALQSKDQSWSSYPAQHGTRTSHTWCEFQIGNDSENRYLFFRNIHAGHMYERHVADLEILRSGTPPAIGFAASSILPERETVSDLSGLACALDQAYKQRQQGYQQELQQHHLQQTEAPPSDNPTAVITAPPPPLELHLFMRSQYPGWTIFVKEIHCKVSYELGCGGEVGSGDWAPFVQYMDELRRRNRQQQPLSS